MTEGSVKPHRAARLMSAARQPGLVLPAVLLILVLTAPVMLGAYPVYLIFTIFLYIALAQSWNLAAGVTGLVSLGHAAFLGLGAYIGALVMIHSAAPLILAMAVGGLAAAGFAAVVCLPMLRLRGIYFAIGTLVVAEAMRLWMVAWPVTGAANGLHLPAAPIPGPTVLYYIALVLAIGSTAALAAIMRSRLGMALNAIRDNEDAAQMMGVNVYRAKLGSLVISSLMTGIAGTLWAAKLAYIEPFSIFNISWTIMMVNMVIIGGMGTLTGPIVGAAFIVLLNYLLADYYAVQVILTGIILILVIRFAPHGIWGTFRKQPLAQRVCLRQSGLRSSAP